MHSELPGYAELHCLSAFSFQRGASIAEELFARAAGQGYRALAITDECSLAGIVRAWQAAKAHGVALIVGAEFQVEDGPKLALLCTDQAAYAGLCQLITTCRRRAAKGEYRCLREDLLGLPDGLLCLWLDRQPIWNCCAPASAIACGWRWNCTTNTTTHAACSSCRPSANVTA